MSDLDTLVVTFQTQLSDVMETVVKTAMYEVTRLVEDGFLQEMKRRNREVESLRIQLQWAERKLNDQEGKDDGKRDDMEPSSDTTELRPKEQQDDNLLDCHVKKESDCMEGWARAQQEVNTEMAQAIDNPSASCSPESQASEEDVLAAVDMKAEQVNKPSCSSVHPGVGWSCKGDGEEGAESDRATEMIEASPKQNQDNCEEDPQISTAYIYPEEREDTSTTSDPSTDMESGWAGLTVTTVGMLQKHGLGTDKDCNPAKGRGSLQQTEQEPANSAAADIRDQISTSASPTARLQNTDALGVTIKQEVIVDSDGCVESEHKERKMKKSTMGPFSAKQRRVSLQPFKQNLISHKATVQEVMRLHPKVSTAVRLQAAIQHLQRPLKRPPPSLSSSTTPSLSAAHTQVVNLNPLNRIPSTSKATPPAPLSVQRAQLGDKPAHNRSGAPWVTVKTQLHSSNSHHINPLPHPDANPHVGPRHLLRCGQCGKCFPHPSNLKAHLQTHTGERPFCCSLCGRSFTKLSNLKAHRRVHTGERPYCCLACGKCFTQKCNLKRHQRIHLDI